MAYLSPYKRVHSPWVTVTFIFPYVCWDIVFLNIDFQWFSLMVMTYLWWKLDTFQVLCFRLYSSVSLRLVKRRKQRERKKRKKRCLSTVYFSSLYTIKMKPCGAKRQKHDKVVYSVSLFHVARWKGEMSKSGQNIRLSWFNLSHANVKTRRHYK